MRERLKILHLVQQPQRRGAETFAYDLTGELLRNGHAVSTAYLYSGAPGQELPLRDGDVVVGADPRHPFERVPGLNPRVVRRLLRRVREFDPDIVQANGARTLKYGSVLSRLARRNSFALVYRSIGDPTVWVRGNFKRAVYRRLIMSRVDGVAAVSRNTMDGLSKTYGLEDQVAAQIPRGIDPQRLAPRRTRLEVRQSLGAGPADPVAIFVGSLTKEKRPDRLARVFKQVALEVPEACLWVVGEGPERLDLEAKLVDFGNRIHFAGTSDDVGSFIGAADVLLLTSDTEGLPGVVLEAAALAVPAVATDVGGVRDAITGGETGMLADPMDENALSAALIRLLTNPGERRRLGRAAQEQFGREFSIENIASRYADLYGEVLASE